MPLGTLCARARAKKETRFETWKDGESEVLGWSQCLSDLGS